MDVAMATPPLAPGEDARRARAAAGAAQRQARAARHRAWCESQRRRPVGGMGFALVSVQYRIALSPGVRREVAAALLEHLLFARAQTPRVVAGLRDDVQRLQRMATSADPALRKQRGNLRRDVRRHARLIEDLRAVNAALADVLSSTANVDLIVFVLGSSLASALEVFALRFHSDAPGPSTVAPSHEECLAIRRKLVRCAIRDSRLAEGCAKSRLRVLVRSSGGGQLANASAFSEAPTFALSQIKLRGSATPVHVFDVSNGPSTTVATVQDLEAERLPEGAKWYALRNHIRSLS